VYSNKGIQSGGLKTAFKRIKMDVGFRVGVCRCYCLAWRRSWLQYYRFKPVFLASVYIRLYWPAAAV
jgi:hypothetical protein